MCEAIDSESDDLLHFDLRIAYSPTWEFCVEIAGKSQSIMRRSVVMSAFTIISRLTGYARIAVIAYALGATTLTAFGGSNVSIGDSYNLANVLPNIIFDLLAGGILGAVFVPVIVEKLGSGNKEEISHVASSMINAGTLLSLVLSVLCFFLAWPITRLMTLSKPAVDAELAVWFFRFFAWQVFFYGVCGIFTGVLTAYRHFVAPVLAPLANNLIVIASGLAFAFIAPKNLQLALIILAAGTTLGVFSMVIIQGIPMLKLGIQYKPVLDLKHPSVRKLGRLSVPILIYTTVGQVALWVTNLIAWSYAGGVTGFQYAWQFFQLPFAIFAVSIITAIFPELSEQHANGRMDEFKRTVLMGIKSIGLIMIPLSALIALFAKPIIQVTLEHGRFNASSTAITSGMLFYLGFGVYFFSITMLILRVFYSMQDTKTPMKLNAIGAPVNIALVFLLVKAVGVTGLGLAQTLTYVFLSAIGLYSLRRRIGSLGIRQLAMNLAKYAVATVPLVVISYVAYDQLSAHLILLGAAGGSIGKAIKALQLLVASTAGLVSYIATAYLLKVEEVSLINKIGRRLFPRLLKA